MSIFVSAVGRTQRLAVPGVLGVREGEWSPEFGRRAFLRAGTPELSDLFGVSESNFFVA